MKYKKYRVWVGTVWLAFFAVLFSPVSVRAVTPTDGETVWNDFSASWGNVSDNAVWVVNETAYGDSTCAATDMGTKGGFTLYDNEHATTTGGTHTFGEYSITDPGGQGTDDLCLYYYAGSWTTDNSTPFHWAGASTPTPTPEPAVIASRSVFNTMTADGAGISMVLTQYLFFGIFFAVAFYFKRWIRPL